MKKLIKIVLKFSASKRGYTVTIRIKQILGLKSEQIDNKS